MNKKKENQQPKSNKIKIIVENFNTKTKKYELGRQEILLASNQEIKDLLTHIPSIEAIKNSIPTRIVSEKFIFQKLNDDLYNYEDNYPVSFFIWTPLYTTTGRGFPFKLEDFDNIVKKFKISQFSKIYNKFSRFLDLIWVLFPLLNIAAMLNIITAEIKKGDSNLLILSFMLWLIGFCVYSLIYSIKKYIKIHKKPQKILIRYDFPLLEYFNTLDTSEFTIVLGQIALLLFTDFYNADFPLTQILIYTGAAMLLMLNTYNFFKSYNRNKSIKEDTQQLLLRNIHSKLNPSEKQYNLQLAVLLKNKPLISVEKVPKFFTLFSVLLTFFPIVTYFIIVS